MTKVICDVHNCKYWAEGDKCVADEIKILSFGQKAYVTIDTFCRTFELERDEEEN